MNSLPLDQATLPWWVEVYTSASQQTHQLGPFKSHEEAKIARTAHVEALDHEEARDIVALIKQHPHNPLTGELLC